MKNRWLRGFVAGGALAAGLLVTQVASAASYVEYYRDNLFLGLAYHRVGCLTNWYTIQANQDYDGFSSKRYCYTGRSAVSVPDGRWFAWNYASGKAQLDTCGERTNDRYGTYNYSSSSSTCNYSIFFDCNSDCWTEAFSRCQGRRVPTISPCW